mmetsp:Transcript_94685/g.267295  ORF Transcript_94685/g.267295 Transcript_94685/m.267295 type:complete len:95 (-) Transcript_94685:1624-1908(-)
MASCPQKSHPPFENAECSEPTSNLPRCHRPYAKASEKRGRSSQWQQVRWSAGDHEKMRRQDPWCHASVVVRFQEHPGWTNDARVPSTSICTNAQ